MPYITQPRRASMDDFLNMVNARVAGERRFGDPIPPAAGPADCGELNYCLSMTCINHGRASFGTLDARLRTIATFWLFSAPLRYQRINDLIGACHGAALELLRRRPMLRFERVTLEHIATTLYQEIGVGYEMKKIAENGDIDYGEDADRAALQSKIKGTKP